MNESGPEEIISFGGETRKALSVEEKVRLVDEALFLLENAYVHLPMKRTMYAVDPVQNLKLLRFRLENDANFAANELEFHRSMIAVVSDLHDLHTAYLVPPPFRLFTAYLPFKVEQVGPWSDHNFIFAHFIAGYEPQAPLELGARILTWNGVPIARAIDAIAGSFGGSNIDARRARAILGLTTRALIRSPVPDEEFILVEFSGSKGKGEIRVEWAYLKAPDSIHWNPADQKTVKAELALAMDLGAGVVARSNQRLYAPHVAELRAMLASAATAPIEGLETQFPECLEAKRVSLDGIEYGYVRLRSFFVADDEAFVDDFVRILEHLPQDGLILDVRDNEGGNLILAERLLQLFTPRAIQAEKAQFISSPLMLQLCKENSPSTRLPLDLSPWIPSLQRAVQTGATYSAAFAISSSEQCNNLGQRYFGPVVLIINALCYSATDIFSAGFQDHEIGPIIGTNQHTGAGGANVWTSKLLSSLVSASSGAGTQMLQAMATGPTFSVAIRRTLRTGTRAGTELEDLGVAPDVVYDMTLNDVLKQNEDLIAFAGKRLKELPKCFLKVTCSPAQPNGMLFEISTSSIDRVDIIIDDRPIRSLDVVANQTRETIDRPWNPTSVVEVLGFYRGRLVARRRDHSERLSRVASTPQ